ncbi:MAG: phosphoribosylformylglycinamidine cyclo-ligase [Eubacteriaceae bacterium]|nr:phosphoribosylformylglycinamidine cyclo-ligase [Eubacteriaceae bacterium]
MGDAYKESGVDLNAGYESVRRIKPLAEATFSKYVLSGIGAFGSAYEVPEKYKRPVLVAATDGVGTKLLIAQAANEHSTVGIDLVAMCANDVLAMGAEPAFFLDYIASSKTVPETIESIVEGIAEGCKQAGCSLVGGETAELPGMYPEGEYDLAGFCVGIAEKSDLLGNSRARAGDMIIGFASSGLHSNGFSLARRALLESGRYSLGEYIPQLGTTLASELLKPTLIYKRQAASLAGIAHSMCHITGGGYYENIPRMLPAGLSAAVSKSALPKLPIFALIQDALGLSDENMFSTFNMGIGFMATVPQGTQVDGAIVIGSVIEGSGEALIV